MTTTPEEIIAQSFAGSAWPGLDERDRYGFRHAARHAIAALSAAGLVIVPREASDLMLAMAANTRSEEGDKFGLFVTVTELGSIWRAMINTRPGATQTEGRGDETQKPAG